MANTRIMGVLNITPDSFYPGSRLTNLDEATRRARQMVEDGADILDVGGESTRPGSDPVSENEETDRVAPVIETLARDIKIPLSVDTRRPAVADACLRLGAHIVNDISGLADPKMLDVVAHHGATVVIMHMRGTPKDMQQYAHYEDVVAEVKRYLADRAAKALRAGAREVIIDPGIGFAKTAVHNLELLKRLREFKDLEYPVLFGASRKSFLGVVTGGLPAEERLEASLAAAVIAVMNGANILRVHDVKATWRAVRVADAANASLYPELSEHGQDRHERNPIAVPHRSA